MKLFMTIFTALFTYGFSAHAVYFPNPATTPIYFCNNDSVQAHVYRTPQGQTMILMEDISSHRAPTRVLQEKVSELSNKTTTIYTSDDLILKITLDDSGFMPSTLILSKDGQATQSEMKCQIIYKIMNQY